MSTQHDGPRPCMAIANQQLTFGQVRAAIDALSPQHRAVVVLRMIDGYSTREAAQILNVPQGTVMSRLARAMGRLESQLKETDP